MPYRDLCYVIILSKNKTKKLLQSFEYLDISALIMGCLTNIMEFHTCKNTIFSS